MIHLAVIGVGWAGTRQVQAIRELADAGYDKFVVECLVDNDAEFLRVKAEELSVTKTYTNYHDALSDPSINAISICTPHALHCEMAIAAAEAGKHVLVEKPIATTVADATCMICAAKRNGITLYVAENLTYAPMSRFLRELVQTGRYIGELTCAAIVNGFRAPNFGYEGRRAWLTKPELGGTGTWMLHGVHSMAQLRYVLGEVESVYLREHKARSFSSRDIEGTLTGTLTLESSVHVNVVQTCETRLPGNLGGYVIHGDRGSVRAWKDGCEVFSSELDPTQEPLRLGYNSTAPAGLSNPAANDELSDPPQAATNELSEYALEMEAFADTVTGIANGPTDGVSERRSLAIVEAGYESAHIGKPVNLKERFGDV